jgi:hypothetical protein
MPEGAVYVGRPTKWGNMYSVEGDDKHGWQVILLGMPAGQTPLKSHAVEMALSFYRDFLAEKLELVPGWLEPLRGKDLACWCPLNQRCHADVLLELANA